jgi:serine/threonine-protein kinase
MDFGIAKSTGDMQLTRPGTTIGSVYYISPEQVRGDTVDARSDIYSFGVTLYEVLTGQKPFQADTSYSVLYAQLNTAPTPPLQVNPSLPPELSGIILHAMQKDPAARFQSADEFRNALKSLMGKHQSAQAPVQAVPVPVQAAQQSPQPAFLSATQAAQPSQPVVQQDWQPIAVPSQQPQAAAPVAAANSEPIQVASKGNRTLWIGLGALTAVLALVAALVALPHLYRTHANQEAAAPATTVPTPVATTDAGTVTQSSTPASDAAAQPNAASPAATPAASQGSQSALATPAATASSSATAKPQHASASSMQSQPGARPSYTSNAPYTPAGPSPQEIRKAHDELMNLDTRAEVARSGVQQIRSQQQAQGLDIRGDILAAMSRMNTALQQANRALEQRDLQTAEDYMRRADREAAILEKFLGR